jgi:hypothetical protein
MDQHVGTLIQKKKDHIQELEETKLQVGKDEYSYRRFEEAGNWQPRVVDGGCAKDAE